MAGVDEVCYKLFQPVKRCDSLLQPCRRLLQPGAGQLCHPVFTTPFVNDVYVKDKYLTPTHTQARSGLAYWGVMETASTVRTSWAVSG